MRYYIKIIINVLVLALVIAQMLVGLYVLVKPNPVPIQKEKFNQIQKSA